MSVLNAAYTSEHVALRAWRRFSGSAATPSAVETLKETSMSSAYRLVGAGMIAKREEAGAAKVERIVYQDILPSLPVSVLRLDGFLPDEDPAFSWLFLEDAGVRECSFETAAHHVLASRWIAQLHRSAAELDAPAELPVRGVDHYLAEMYSVRGTIRERLEQRVFTTADRLTLETIVGLCELAIARWNRIRERCEGIPETLVHGDFHAKNTRIRCITGELAALCVFDWDYAGWGLPAADLPGLALSAYVEVAGIAWATGQWLASLGRLLQCISAIAWACMHLRYESAEKGMQKLREYPTELRAALAAMERD